MAHPKCFISYSWDNNANKEWVRLFGEELQKNGVEVLLDQWDIHLGADLTQYMETSVRDSDYVLLICTPTFARKANEGKGGVGYEKMIVTGEIFHGTSSPKKFVPILKDGDIHKSLPSYLKSKYYIDFRDNKEFVIKMEELLRHIHSLPKLVRPPLGNKPLLAPLSSSSAPFMSNVSIYCSRCGAFPTGKPTVCTGAYSNHNFVPMTRKVYCTRCRVAPGTPTVCTGAYSNHNFVTKIGEAYCGRCGALPTGKPTVCTGAYSNHNFVPMTRKVYCTRCGVAPGTPTVCTGAYSNHNFVQV